MIELPSDQARTMTRAQAPQLALVEALQSGDVLMSPILESLGVDVRNPAHQAALLTAAKYDLDPLRKEIIVIPGSGPYISRDGWLTIAHRSGVFDGMDVVERGATTSHWWAVVAVYRKDMSRPFKYPGRYPKTGKNAKHGEEMAIKVAEVAALRRAFPVTAAVSAEEMWLDAGPEPVTAEEVLAQAGGPEALDDVDVVLTVHDHDDDDVTLFDDAETTP